MCLHPIRLFLLIRDLNVGGAQRQAVELVKALDKSRFCITVVTFYDGGALRSELKGLVGVRVVSLSKRGRWDLFPFSLRLWRAVRAARPQILHGYLAGANELGLCAGRASGAKVVWGIRASSLELSHYDLVAQMLLRLGAYLSVLPDLLIVNSYAGRKHYANSGYATNRMVVIQNGVDTDRFRPDPEGGTRLRDEWSVGPDERLIGLVGRIDPMKDHETFLRAAAMIRKSHPETRFLCIGDGPDGCRMKLESLAAEIGIGDRVIWSHSRGDMPAVYSALDILTMSSAFGEGVPNVVLEAMACSTPCVVTDVGDAASLVATAEQIVPVRSPEKLAEAWERLLRLPPRVLEERRQAARSDVLAHYSVGLLARRTQAVLETLVATKG